MRGTPLCRALSLQTSHPQAAEEPNLTRTAHSDPPPARGTASKGSKISRVHHRLVITRLGHAAGLQVLLGP